MAWATCRRTRWTWRPGCPGGAQPGARAHRESRWSPTICRRRPRRFPRRPSLAGDVRSTRRSRNRSTCLSTSTSRGLSLAVARPDPGFAVAAAAPRARARPDSGFSPVAAVAPGPALLLLELLLHDVDESHGLRDVCTGRYRACG